MARKQASDYEERRRAIVDKAADLFAVSGFLGASVLDLSKACGMSKSLLYHYYPSKEEVLYAVMASHIDQLVDAIIAVQKLALTPREKLHKLLLLFMEIYVDAAARQKVVLNDLDHLPQEKRALIVDKQRTIINYVQELLQQIDAGLAASRAKARVRTMLLFGMINWTGNWYDPAGPVKPDQIAETVLEMVAPAD